MTDQEKAALAATNPQVVADAMNKTIKDVGADTNLISDGYHTFCELYDHRITLYITLLRHLKEQFEGTYFWDIWRTKVHSDGSVWDGWFILGVYEKPGEQITYHLPIEKWDECSFATEREKAPEYDGHTSADVLERLKTL